MKHNYVINNKQLMEEWNWDKNNALGLFPDKLTCGVSIKVWWKCKKGHRYEASANNRIGRNQGCPFCANKKVLAGYNDLATTNPELVKEWDWEHNIIKPSEISFGSQKVVNWICKRGHRWRAVVYSRANCGCPYCAKELKISYPEKVIAFYIKKLFPDLIENYKDKLLGKHELDVFIPKINVAIEYDGAKWHQNVEKDKIKDDLCNKLKITLIRVREIGCPDYGSASKKLFLHYNNQKELIDTLYSIIQFLSVKTGTILDLDVDLARDSSYILQDVISREKENAISNTKLIKEWNWIKNHNVNPDYISTFSNKKYWWVCNKGHEWYASVSHRSGGRGCPYCAGQKLIVGFNDLASQYPQVAQEWDYSKNDKKPTEVTARNNKKFWWICSKCNHSWKTPIYVRTGMGCGCPECKKMKLKKISSRKVLNVEKNIIYDSLNDASKQLNINASAISNCCRGATQTSGGYHWKYVDE